MKIFKRLGWKKDPFDPKAWDFSQVRKLKAVPPEYDLSKWRPPIKDQGNCGSCVGMALSSILTAEANKLGVALPEIQRFSETDIYNGGRFIDGTLPLDTGTYPSSALKWLSKKGCLPYKYWPYIGFEKRSRPSDLDDEAAQYPLSGSLPLTIGYYRLTGGVDGIISALAEDHMVMLGIPWPSSWMYSRDGVLPIAKPSDRVYGGHAVYLYGYSIPNKLVFGANSWGTRIWSYSGDKLPTGCFCFHFQNFDWFKREGGYDAHIVIVEWAPTPEPPPTPEPDPEFKPQKRLGVRVQYTLDGGNTWNNIIEVIS